jgi:hypothetical protein
MPDLDQDGRPVDLGPVRLRTPGLRGQVTVHQPASPGSRAAASSTAAFIEALVRAEVSEGVTIEIADHREVTPSTGSRAAGGSDDMVLEVRDPGQSFGQAVLYEAEDGTLSWHFPRQAAVAGVTRSGGALTYRIPREVVVTAPGEAVPGGQRGVLGAVGKKILKVLVFKIVDEASQYIGDKLARRFEAQHRPHRLRGFTPDDFRVPRTSALDPAALQRVAEDRALLFVHGTASSSHGGFGRIPHDVFSELYQRYGGRVLALDHPTVSVSPEETVAWLAGELAALGDRRLTVDIVSHSRGGLVSRLLSEHPQLTSGRLDVGRLVMVATPNAGTELARPERLGHLLNRLTSLLQLVPSNGITDALDVILAVVKQVAIGAFKGLDGIMVMDPQGGFLTEVLNTPTSTTAQYFAAAADFEPPRGAPLLRIARDGVTDLVFGSTENDLVVPTEGVYTVPGASRFPITERLVFGALDGVDHSGYWTRPAFIDNLLGWLA